MTKQSVMTMIRGFVLIMTLICNSIIALANNGTYPVVKPWTLLSDDQVDGLRKRSSDPAWRDQVDALKEAADKAIAEPYASVTAGGVIRQNNPHLYWTELPYQFTGGQRDGVVNPQQDRTDYQAAIALGRQVRDLSLAYVITDDQRYARSAIERLLVWCVHESTRMEPIFPNNQSRIELCITLPGTFYGMSLLRDCPAWRHGEYKAVKLWIADLVKAARKWDGANNFGNWRVVLLASGGILAEDQESIQEAWAAWKRLFDKQVNPEGLLPEETRRSKSLFYSTYALNAMVMGAEIARLQGVDLWSHRNPYGMNLIDVLKIHAVYVIQPDNWPHKQIEPYKGENTACYEWAWSVTGEPLFAQVISHWGRPLHETRIAGPVTLTHGRQLPEQINTVNSSR